MEQWETKHIVLLECVHLRRSGNVNKMALKYPGGGVGGRKGGHGYKWGGDVRWWLKKSSEAI